MGLGKGSKYPAWGEGDMERRRVSCRQRVAAAARTGFDLVFIAMAALSSSSYSLFIYLLVVISLAVFICFLASHQHRSRSFPIGTLQVPGYPEAASGRLSLTGAWAAANQRPIRICWTASASASGASLVLPVAAPFLFVHGLSHHPPTIPFHPPFVHRHHSNTLFRARQLISLVP
jgi:hypothetical protein